jgi:hypothetical protein
MTVIRTAILIAALTAASALALGQTAESKTDEKAVASLNAATPLTIYPVIMMGGPRKDVADVIGLMMERQGMTKHVTTDTKFDPESAESIDALAKQFDAFLNENAPETTYALCVEFVGSPGTGPEEIRLVLADKTGKTVWSDAQRPSDPEFKRIEPKCPMTCCVMVKERLSPLFKVSGAIDRPVKGGRFERIWERRSGTPTEAEEDEMDSRLAALSKSGANARVLVYPARIRDEVDRGCAEHLATLLNEEGLCKATVADAAPKFEFKPSPNEQRVLWDFARAVREYVKANPPDAEYALFPDYLMGGSHVGGVHFVLCDRDGGWVLVDYQNSHHGDFKRIRPESRQDCDRLVAKRYARRLD